MPLESAPFKRILVATDFSPHAATALQKAIDVARACEAEVTVAHVIEDLRSAMSAMSWQGRWELVAGDIERFQQELCRGSEAKLARLIEPFQAAGARVRHITLVGTPFIKLIQAVQADGYELVIVGTRGMSGMQRMFIGSTAERLVRHCPAPVWVVKSETAAPLKSILAPTDFSEASGRALAIASGLAQQAAADLHVLHVVESAEAADQLPEVLQTTKRTINRQVRQQLAEFTAAHAGEVSAERQKVVWAKPAKAITDLANRLKVDLLVLGSVGRGGITGMLIGNTAEKVLRTVRCDVVAVKPAGFVSSIEPSLQVM